MKGFGGGMAQLMKQANQMQMKMKKLQEELATRTYDGTAGGGAVMSITTFMKFAVLSLGLSAFWSGFAAGLNYATSFVLIMLLHLTVATKQPAVTAPATERPLGSSMDTFVPGATRSLSLGDAVAEIPALLRGQFLGVIGA